MWKGLEASGRAARAEDLRGGTSLVYLRVSEEVSVATVWSHGRGPYPDGVGLCTTVRAVASLCGGS